MSLEHETGVCPRLLGIEGGGTHTTAVYKAGDKVEIEKFGVGNIYLLTEGQLRLLFEQIYNRFPEVDCVVAGMAGARNEADFHKIRLILESLWEDAICAGTNDLEVGIANAASPEAFNKILLVSGTGSCAYGKSSDGKVVKVGAWGHLLGDKGSAYDMAIRALNIIATEYDIKGEIIWGKRILETLSLKSMDDLVTWTKTATKADIASLAKFIFEMREEGDDVAKKIIRYGLNGLADLTNLCARRLSIDRTDKIEILASGGNFKHNKWFFKVFSMRIKRLMPFSKVTDISDTSYLGAIKLAEEYYYNASYGNRKIQRSKTPGLVLSDRKDIKPESDRNLNPIQCCLPVSTDLSPTELPNPLSRDLDKMPPEDAIHLFLQEDAKLPGAILPFVNEIAKAIRIIADSFKSGGRLIYAGAGTSGRLAMLDAAECPPTFGVDPQMVQAIIAGGPQALQKSIEGAEDDFFAGQSEVFRRNVDSRDVVFGIAASGTTKFVWGALAAAKKRGAKTMLLCFNPNLKLPSEVSLDVFICPDTGAELLTGSTRLKAGTATKMILNIISTISMAQIGRIKGNLMLKMLPTNEKLRQRAVRIVSQAGNVPEGKAKSLLEKSNWDIQSALSEAQKLAR